MAPDRVVMEVAFENWMLALAALIFGVGIGWLLWGGRPLGDLQPQPGSDAADPAPAPAGEMPATSNDPEVGSSVSVAPNLDPDKLGGIERELKEARELLNEGEEELRLFGDEIAALDGALKRVNARLRLLVRETRRRTPDGGGDKGA